MKEALADFRVLMDTREQLTQRTSGRIKAIGVPVERRTLSYGDYCADIPLNGAASLYGTSAAICAPCAIERKMSLDELAGCFTRGRDRFRREFQRAEAAGAKVYLLVENASWEAIINHRYRSRMHPEAFMASISSWMIRYQFTPIFCKADISGRIIREILLRDMKERLENGEYG